MKKLVSPFAAMRYCGITRDHFRNLPKNERLFLWIMVVANLNWSYFE